MSEHRKPAGHVFVAERQSGRVYFAKWRDGDGQHQKRLGPAWVKPHGQTARGAPRWRAADGRKPGPQYMTPEDAREALAELLTAAPKTERVHNPHRRVTLRQAADEWLRCPPSAPSAASATGPSERRRPHRERSAST